MPAQERPVMLRFRPVCL